MSNYFIFYTASTWTKILWTTKLCITNITGFIFKNNYFNCSCTSVSYTHLDVYKRQYIYRMRMSLKQNHRWLEKSQPYSISSQKTLMITIMILMVKVKFKIVFLYWAIKIQIKIVKYNNSKCLLKHIKQLLMLQLLILQ